MGFLLCFLFYSVAFSFLLFQLKKYRFTPSMLFVIMQVVMFTGILQYVNLSFSTDVKYLMIYCITLIMFILGYLLFYVSHKKREYNDSRNIKINEYQTAVIIVIIFTSIILCCMFFKNAGTNVFLLIVRSLMGNKSEDVTTLRLSISSSNGSGYIYQFRVILLPLLVMYCLFQNEKKGLRVLGVFCMPLALMFLLGTGQRGGFVMLVLMVVTSLIYIYIVYRNKRIRNAIIILISCSLLLFMLMTVFNGRVASGKSVFSAVLKRMFLDNQLAAVTAFRYIDSLDIQYGIDWLMTFKDILPGKNEYRAMSYRVFTILYGSTRGSAPPCIWGSTYYNFGYVGIVVFPFMLGYLYNSIFQKFISKEMNYLRIFVYSGMFVTLGSWVAGEPVVLFNNGFASLYILGILLNIDKSHIRFGKL